MSKKYEQNDSDIIKYPTGRLSLIGSLFLLAALGIVLTVVLHYFFA